MYALEKNEKISWEDWETFVARQSLIVVSKLICHFIKIPLFL